MVGMAPRVIWREYEGVCDIADGVVDPLVVGKRAVTSIVPNAENSSTDKALEPPVCGPESPFEGESDVRVEAHALKSLDERVDLLGGLDVQCHVSCRGGDLFKKCRGNVRAL